MKHFDRKCSRRFSQDSDDTFNVLGVHLVGGLGASILIDVAAESSVFVKRNEANDGLIVDGGPELLRQMIHAIAVDG